MPRIDKSDLGLIAGRYVTALKLANGRIESVKACNAKVRNVFAGEVSK